MGVEVSEPTPTDNLEFTSFEDVLKEDNIDSSILPTWLPQGYEIADISLSESPLQKQYIAYYTCDDKNFRISVRVFMNERPEQLEMSTEYSEVYAISGINFYIFSNYDQLQAAWLINSYECSISGNLEIEEIKKMIDSIGKD